MVQKDNDISIIIPAAGAGRRMKSYGPKPLIKIGNCTIIKNQISLLKSYIPDASIILVCGFKAERLMSEAPDHILKVENEFYEHSKIFENYYGTSKSSVNEILKNNCNVLFDIDWKGAQQLRKFKELNLVTIFILPPSKEELKKRLIARSQDGEESIQRRLLAYSEDIKHSKEYEHVLVNDDIESCFNEIKKIILNN